MSTASQNRERNRRKRRAYEKLCYEEKKLRAEEICICWASAGKIKSVLRCYGVGHPRRSLAGPRSEKSRRERSRLVAIAGDAIRRSDIPTVVF